MGKIKILKKTTYFLLAFIILGLIGYCMGNSDVWTFKTELMKNIKPYDGADLRLNGNNVFLMQVTQPALEFKTAVSSVKDDDPIPTTEFKEDWMNDSYEVLNRMSVRVLKGTLENDVNICFEAKGQDGSWWISDDTKTIYVTSDWLDNHKINEYVSEDEYINFTYFSIYKSVDGGETFKKLAWPEHTRITQILFAQDGKRGYIVAGGPSLWRTEDGGESWQKIIIPKLLSNIGIGNTALERYQNEITTFDAYTIDDQGNLLIAGFIKGWQPKDSNEKKQGSVIYQLKWSDNLSDMNLIEPLAFVNNVKVSDIEISSNNELYLLTEHYNFSDPNVHPKDKELGFIHLQGEKEIVRHVFGKKLFLGKLYLGKNDLLYTSGFTWTSGGLQDNDFAFISKDKGSSWQAINDGRASARASYFDKENNTVWILKINSLYFKVL